MPRRPFTFTLGASMSHQFLLLVFIVAFSLEFVAFGMQRATLLISREADVPYHVASALLPLWFPATWILRITKWSCLIAIAVMWSLGVAGGLLVAEIILSAILPIPYGVYMPLFWKRVSQIKKENVEAGEFLEQMLGASKIQGT